MSESSNGKNGQEGKKMVAEIRVYCDPHLKDEAGKLADAEGLPLSEYVARLIAAAIKRPDLAHIPRKHSGRPRKPMAL